MEAPVVVMLALAVSTPVASAPNPSKDAIVEFFSAKGAPPVFPRNKNAVEICADWCDYYETDESISSAKVWDVIFLHQYYYVGTGPREDFREKYSSLAEELMSRYGRLCPRAIPESRPGCVIGYLGLRHRIRTAHVRYDEGYRCEVWGHLVHTKTIYKSSCRKVKHAS